MKLATRGHPYLREGDERFAARCTSDLPVNVPSELSVPRPSGTVDDDDEPEDEHDNENETPAGQTSDRTEAPQESVIDRKDRSSELD